MKKIFQGVGVGVEVDDRILRMGGGGGGGGL